MAIKDKTINKLEELAMLKLEATEKAELKKDLEKTIAMFDKLSELDTTGVEPMRNVHSHKQELRDDTVVQIISKKEALSNSNKANDDYFIVPKVINKTI